MRKVFAIMLCMIFAVCSAYAQNLEEIEEQVDTLTVQQPISAETDVVPESDASPQYATKSDLAELSSLLTAIGNKMLEGDAPETGKLTFPVEGKTKFARSHYIYQTIEISPIAGKDKDPDDGDDGDDVNHDGKNDNIPDVMSNLNLGMNIGYSLIFVPGKINGDMLEINRFGFAYSTGFIASFDRQDNYDVTCDFLGKFGLETGNGHALGIGVDFLLGGGKTAGTIYDLDDEELTPEYYTMWCFKQGVQVWLKTNLLTTAIKNTDILAFARFVHSSNPQNDDELLKANLFNQWIEESWQFGVTLRYRF